MSSLESQLSKEELDFISWWEKNRKEEKKWDRNIKKGIGMGLMLSFPIVLAVLFRGWYKRMPFVSGTQLIFILLACLIISLFYAILKGSMEWEIKETKYKQLKRLLSDAL